MSGRARRSFHPDVPGEGAVIVLDPEESHHLARVLRLRAADEVAVFDGRGGEWGGRLLEVSHRAARIAVGAPRTDAVEPRLHVTLVQGACRPDRIEWVLQKGTEVGVSAFAIVPFARSEGDDHAPAKRERWRRIVLEACKQSGRRRLPEVVLLEAPAPLESGSVGIVLDAGAPGVGRILAGPRAARVAIAVGPEGGVAPEEVESLARAGWRPAGLGPRTLRTETAGAIAAALVLHAWDDLGGAAVDSPEPPP